MLDDGHGSNDVAELLGMSGTTVRRVGFRYREEGLDSALRERPRPGQARLLKEEQEARIIAMVCSRPLEGRARWTVRLVAEEAVRRKLVPRVGRETIRLLLKSHDLKPWREKNVVRSEARQGVHREDGGRS
jgi:transposase